MRIEGLLISFELNTLVVNRTEAIGRTLWVREQNSIVCTLPLCLILMRSAGKELEHITGFCQCIEFLPVKIAPQFHAFSFFAGSLNELLHVMLVSIELVKLLQQFSSICFLCCQWIASGWNQCFELLNSLLKLLTESELRTQLRVIGQSFCFLRNVHYPSLLKHRKESIILLMEHQEVVFLHLCNHTAASFLASSSLRASASRLDFTIF